MAAAPSAVACICDAMSSTVRRAACSGSPAIVVLEARNGDASEPAALDSTIDACSAAGAAASIVGTAMPSTTCRLPLLPLTASAALVSTAARRPLELWLTDA
eukprot:5735342-Prymnesium_polylepis.2